MMFSLVKAALVVATLVVQSTAMAITSNQLTNETATISFGDQLKLDLRRNDVPVVTPSPTTNQQPQYPVNKFDCVQIFVEYSEPTSKELNLYLTSDMLSGAGTNAESSLSLTPGKFTVHVKADTTEGTKNLVCDDPAIGATGQYEGTTDVIDFYSPSARNILVVLIRTGVISSIANFSDDLFDKRYAPIFSQFQSCPSVRVDENCPHTIEVSTINPAHGEVPFDLAVANGEEFNSYKVQYDHVQKIAISSASFTTKSDTTFQVDPYSSRQWFFSEGEAPFDTLFSADSGITIQNLAYTAHSDKIYENNELFVTQRQSTTLPPYGDVAPYNAFRKNRYASEVTDAEAPFAHQRKWDSLAINPKNFVMYQVDTSEPTQDLVLSIPPGTMCISDTTLYDENGQKCAAYEGAPNQCGIFDTTEFSAVALCCECSGGTAGPKIDGTFNDRVGTLVAGTGADTGSRYILLEVGNLVDAGWTDNGNFNLPTGTEAINTTHLTELSTTDLSSLLEFKDTNGQLLTIALTAASGNVQLPIDVFPGTLEYTVTAYGNERDPEKVSGTDQEHHCDISITDINDDNACATSELKLETSITNSAEVRIGTQVAHQPIFTVPAAGDITHVDTASTVDATVDYGFGVNVNYGSNLDTMNDFQNALLPHGSFSVTLTDADIGEGYHRLNGVFDVVENYVPMQACNKFTCEYEACPASPGSAELDGTWRNTVNANTNARGGDGFTVSVPAADPTKIQFDFDWRPSFPCVQGKQYSQGTDHYNWCQTQIADNVKTDGTPRQYDHFDLRLRFYGTTYCQYSFAATDTTSQLDADNENVDDLSSGTVLVMIRVHPVSAGYVTELANYIPPSVSFSALAMSQIRNDQVDIPNYLIVEAHNNRRVQDASGQDTDDYNNNHVGAVKECSASQPSDERSLGIKTDTANPDDAVELCCKIDDGATWSTTDEAYASNQRKFTFTFNQFDNLGGTPFVDFKGDNIMKVDDTETHRVRLFYKLCFVARRNVWPYDDMPILLDNSIERITTTLPPASSPPRRSARQLGDDSAQNIELPPTNQLFLDFSADGVLTVSFDDQQQPVISVEPNDEIAPQKEVSTTSPQLEDENNTTEQITTTLLGLIIGAVLILLVIVVVAVMMLNKRKEAAAKVYPFWMPGTDVTKTTVQA